MSNPFASDAAERYHVGRPRHHERTLRHLGFALPRHGVVLDVAGGTGLSTIALQSLGANAVCIDIAMPMLAVARREVPALAAAAESLPVRDGGGVMITVSSGVHWFDQEAFYAEARRALADDGVLVLYEHGFLGVMVGRDDFSEWSWRVYGERYPAPPRGTLAGTAVPTGFTKVGEDGFTERIALTRDELVAYLLTQSNTIDPVEAGRESLDEVATWLRDSLTPFYDGESCAELEFFGRIDWWSPTS